jgi:hypothetical protein
MKIVKKNKTYFINPDNLDEENKIDFFLNKSLNLEKKDSLLVLSILNKPSSLNNKDSVRQKIINLFNDKDLTFQNRVEGTFEKLLNKDDLIVFKEMIKNKEIEIFKPSTKYKKGVYQISFNKNKSFSPQNTSSINKNTGSVFSLFNKNKYVILKNSEDAKKFSYDFEQQIKSGKIIGLKSFDNNYYVIYKSLFLEIKDKLLSLNLKNSFSIDSLKTKLEFSKEVLKIAIELLKEEGLILEKKKEVYEFI